MKWKAYLLAGALCSMAAIAEGQTGRIFDDNSDSWYGTIESDDGYASNNAPDEPHDAVHAIGQHYGDCIQYNDTQHHNQHAVWGQSEYDDNTGYNAGDQFHAWISVHNDRGGGHGNHEWLNSGVRHDDGNRQRNNEYTRSVRYDRFGERHGFRKHDREWNPKPNWQSEHDRFDERVINDAVVEHNRELELRIAPSGAIAGNGIPAHDNTPASEVKLVASTRDLQSAAIGGPHPFQ